MENNNTEEDLLKINTMDIDLTTQYIQENIEKTHIVFCNPLSGNLEGKIILDTASKYKTQENYRLIDFQHLKSKITYEPIKAVFFELVNQDDNSKGQILLKHCVERCKKNN